VPVEGQTNWPRSSFFVNMQRPTQSCQSSFISPAGRVTFYLPKVRYRADA
jgi:hypothetical protein